jgi:hypothetical protein
VNHCVAAAVAATLSEHGVRVFALSRRTNRRRADVVGPHLTPVVESLRSVERSWFV